MSNCITIEARSLEEAIEWWKLYAEPPIMSCYIDDRTLLILRKDLNIAQITFSNTDEDLDCWNAYYHYGDDRFFRPNNVPKEMKEKQEKLRLLL